MIRFRLTLISSLALVLVASDAGADAVGISGTDTPETIGLSVGIGVAFPANPDHIEYYAGAITAGNSIQTFHTSSVFGGPSSLAWHKFTSDGVSDIIFDTFGSTAGFDLGDGKLRIGNTLGVFDANGSLVLKQHNVRTDAATEPVYIPHDFISLQGTDLEGYVHPTNSQGDLPPVGNLIHNATLNPLDTVARARISGAFAIEITAIAPPPSYSITADGGSHVILSDRKAIWSPNRRETSQIAFVKNPTPNPLWDPLHPQHDPDADWDQYPILPAGDYFIAASDFVRFSGFAPDMVDQTKQVGDIVGNFNAAIPDPFIPDDGAGNPVRFGFTTLHPRDGIMTLNARKPGDFDADVDADADDIDTLFDRVAALSGQGLDIDTGVTLDGLPLNFLSVGPDNWQPEIDMTLNDMMLDLTGNSRIDLGDVRMLVWNILDTEFGDANLDGVVDATDESIVNGNFGNPGGWADGDFNGDDVVDQLDLDILQGNLPSLLGDLDGDGFVGIDDLNLVLGNWNQNVPPANPLADPSGDGFVGIDDLNEVLGNWNAGTPPTANAVPEPGTIMLLTAGLVGLGKMGRMSHKRV